MVVLSQLSPPRYLLLGLCLGSLYRIVGLDGTIHHKGFQLRASGDASSLFACPVRRWGRACVSASDWCFLKILSV